MTYYIVEERDPRQISGPWNEVDMVRSFQHARLKARRISLETFGGEHPHVRIVKVDTAAMTVRVLRAPQRAKAP